MAPNDSGGGQPRPYLATFSGLYFRRYVIPVRPAQLLAPALRGAGLGGGALAAEPGDAAADALLVLNLSQWMRGYAGWFDSHDGYSTVMFYVPWHLGLLTGPAYYLYFRSLTNQEFRWRLLLLLHLMSSEQPWLVPYKPL